jgi:hypothetical protein
VLGSLSQKLLQKPLPAIFARFCAEFLAGHEPEGEKTDGWQAYFSKIGKKAALDIKNGRCYL